MTSYGGVFLYIIFGGKKSFFSQKKKIFKNTQTKVNYRLATFRTTSRPLFTLKLRQDSSTLQFVWVLIECLSKRNDSIDIYRVVARKFTFSTSPFQFAILVLSPIAARGDINILRRVFVCTFSTLVLLCFHYVSTLTT